MFDNRYFFPGSSDPNLPIDISEDWRMMQYLVDGTYYSRESETSFATPVSCSLLKRENRKKTMFGRDELNLGNHECIWEAFVSGFQLPVVCKIGDKFTVAGITGVQTWGVLGVDYSTHVSRFRLHAYQEGFNS